MLPLTHFCGFAHACESAQLETETADLSCNKIGSCPSRSVCALPFCELGNEHAARIHRNWRNYVVNRYRAEFVQRHAALYLVVSAQCRYRQGPGPALRGDLHRFV